MAVTFSKTEFFQNVRINRLVQTLASATEVAQPLTFLGRTPVVNATEDEITGKFSGQIFAADLITEDAEAVIVEGGRFETSMAAGVPKIKIGARVSEGLMVMLNQMAQGVDLAGQSDLITGWENQLAGNLLQGVRQTMNRLCCDMMLDATSYDRYGVKLTTSFGTPNELKVTVTPWTDVVNSTPMDDIYDLVTYASSIGKTYDRITMATTTFQALTASNQFMERMRQFLRLEPTTELSLRDVNVQRVFETITGLNLELENTTYRVRNANGSQTQQRVLPLDKVILSSRADDNSTAYDFANAIVPETISAQFIAGAPDLGGIQFGPVSYYTGNIELNPPDLRAWAVAKGFPRKHDELASAVLTVL